MAYKIIRDKTNFFQRGREITAILDSVNDLNSLGTDFAPGSVAIVATTGSPTYLLNASKEWKAI